MSDDVVRRLRLTKESCDYLEDYAEKNNIPYDNRTINLIIEEHKQIKDQTQMQQEMIQSISENVSKEVKKEVKRVLLGTNNTDRNTQVIIELLNGLFIENNVSDILTTDDMESKPVHTAKTFVQERIKHQQQKRADYYQQRG
ncbi:hypothetical protein GLW04_19300 [Halobacillus litoralis]|uniref:Uncharacterized protein n=1 Tax=Halobacillus litoralis TaxID=45668 RepID=A0A845E8P7_9BACI|nr:hypothetical protein [Halobacillus litoralis]MYL22024.1 hypothetical protein [Halobacillus litoralis]MYL39834.1 hypothetical protein [Halobacillus litoralis]